MTFTTKWSYGKDSAKQDAIWFYGTRHIGTASLEADGETYTLDIYCDGETKYRIPHRNEDGTLNLESYDYVRYVEDWNAHKIYTDEELNDFVNELLQVHGYEAHIYNSWFDLYVEIDGVSEHIDAVTHTQDEAEAQAEAVLREVAAHGGWKPYLNTLGWNY